MYLSLKAFFVCPIYQCEMIYRLNLRTQVFRQLSIPNKSNKIQCKLHCINRLIKSKEAPEGVVARQGCYSMLRVKRLGASAEGGAEPLQCETCICSQMARAKTCQYWKAMAPSEGSRSRNKHTAFSFGFSCPQEFYFSLVLQS